MPPIAATSRIILSVSVRGSAAAIASAPGIHDVQQTDVTTLWDFNVASSDASTLRRSGRNEFLFAPVGTEANGMTLSVVSLLARLGSDPWLEAGREARCVAAVGSNRESGAQHRQYADESLVAAVGDCNRCRLDKAPADPGPWGRRTFLDARIRHEASPLFRGCYRSGVHCLRGSPGSRRHPETRRIEN